jgi:hypothetical protein
MAGGGFIIAAAIYLFNWKKYKPIGRPAIMTAFLGYLMAIIALFLDIGHPFRLWHPAIMWQVHSIMWIVAIHVILYTTTLAIESSPMFFERFGMKTALSGVKKTVTVKLMAAGKINDWLFLKKIVGISELKFRDHMFGGGVIADDKEAMLFLGEEKPSLVIWSNHGGLVGFAREYFQFLWDASLMAKN